MEVKTIEVKITIMDTLAILSTQDLSRLLFAPLAKSTSPRRRTPPLRQTSSATFAYAADAPLLSLCDIFPVSSGTFTRFTGEHTPEGKASRIAFAVYCPSFTFIAAFVERAV